jgi:tetratricopeptide (TPR) repeat protein
MFPVTSGRRVLILALALIAAVAMASPTSAQPTGLLKGKVLDASKKPVEGAQVVIEFQGGINRKYTVPTNKKGEYTQVGLQPGAYKVTVTKDKLVQSKDVRVRLGDPTELDFDLMPGGGGPTKEDLAKVAALNSAFEAGVVADKAGNYDEAIAKFTESARLLAEAAKKETCYECYLNIAHAYSAKQDYEKAEAALQKALEIKPDYTEAYSMLASVYNNERKFDLAREAAKKALDLQTSAAGGAATAKNADDVYNQGVIAWNGNNFDDAKAAFEEVLKINPNHADSHYWLGMWLVRNNKIPEAVAEFETYLKLAPTGKRAAEAKTYVDALKKK